MTVTVHLTIDRSAIGDYRARRVFQACRHFAYTIAANCPINVNYRDHERVGWSFEMPSEIDAMRLRLYHQRVMTKPVY